MWRLGLNAGKIFAADWLAGLRVTQVRLEFVPATLERPAVTAKSRGHRDAIERACDALEAVDALPDCCVDVGGSVLAGLDDVGDEVLDFHGVFCWCY